MKKISVLVVDDSMVSRAVIKAALSGTNFEICDYAENGMEAIEKYGALQPEVVTMDMNLPDANGIECSKMILAMNPAAKIIMISAMKDHNLIAQGRSVGICSFLQKPVKTQDLLDTIWLVCQKDSCNVKSLQDFYVKPFAKGLRKGLFSLAGLESKVHTEVNKEAFVEIDGIAVIIGLTGDPVGRAILHMDTDAMQKFSESMLNKTMGEELAAEAVTASVEEAANIIIGRGVSLINDVFKDKEMRITPPGTICGHKIRIANAKVLSFNIVAMTRLGEFKLNIGFAEGD